MKEIFSKSENFKEEYCATVVRVGELKDIENSDNLKQCIIDGFSVVVNKNDVKEGDYMIYCKNETELSSQFLSVNNMYEIGERERNANYAEVQSLMDEGKQDEAKAKVGYFGKHGRVKMIRLRGCPSFGVLMRIESLKAWDPEIGDIDLSKYVEYDDNGNLIPFDFDTVNGKLFIKAYVPRVANRGMGGGGNGKKKDKTKQFDRIIEGEFRFHYDTSQLNSNMWKFSPESEVYVSVKVHGTSVVIGNVLVKKPTLLNKFKDLYNLFLNKRIKKVENKIYNLNTRSVIPEGEPYSINYDMVIKEISELERKKLRIENRMVRKFDTEYYNVYSSRTVIKNQYINKYVNSGFYSTDIWGEYHDMLEGKIPENVTVYGEIVGYLTGSDRMIQKGYDYGCPVGANKMMIYRVSEKMPDGTHREYEIDEVINFTNELITKYPEIRERIMDYPLLYHGKMFDLYPFLDPSNHWNENVLESMKQDVEFGMEKDEPLCNNKVPREGVCVRIANDPVNECFKLKTTAFLQRESKNVDKGEVDIEMADTYSEENI